MILRMYPQPAYMRFTAQGVNFIALALIMIVLVIEVHAGTSVGAKSALILLPRYTCGWKFRMMRLFSFIGESPVTCLLSAAYNLHPHNHLCRAVEHKIKFTKRISNTVRVNSEFIVTHYYHAYIGSDGNAPK